MKRSLLGCGLFIALTLMSVLRGAPETSSAQPKSEKELRAILKQKCDEVNQFYKAEGFPIQIGDPTSSPIKFRTDDFTKETVALFDTNQNPMIVRAALQAESGNFFGFYSYEVAHAHQRSPRFEIPPPAKLSEAQATEIATKFADIFIKPWNKQYLGKPTASFSYSELGDDRKTGKWVTGGGEWDVKWEEHTPSGIPFFGNDVSVKISEEYGPYQISIGSMLPEDEIGHLNPVPQEQALLSAKKGLDAAVAQAQTEGKAYNATGGFAVSKKASEISLTVELLPYPPEGMFPSDLFLPKGLPKSGFLGPTKYRLVWMVKYLFWTANPMQRGYMVVYIDAQDGSVLCCSYPEGLA